MLESWINKLNRLRRVIFGLGPLASALLYLTAPPAASQVVTQKTLGPCSPAIANVAGPVVVNCVVISLKGYYEFLQQQEQELRAKGDPKDLEIAETIRRKLENPEEAYVVFAAAAQAYLKQLDAAEGKVGPALVREAAVGNEAAPGKILGALSAAQDSAGVLAFTLSLGDLLESQGNIRGAISAYEQALLSMPTNGALLRRYSALLIEVGKLSDSIKMLEKVLADDEKESKLSAGDLALVYDALGEGYQSIGNLDAADDRFKFAIQSGGRAAKDGSINRIDFASILNDSAGVSIRKKDLGRAEENLCRAVQEFSSSLGFDHRSTIGAELNLTTVWRELGQWGDARFGLVSLQDRIANLPTEDPLRAYLPILSAQTDFFLGQDERAKTSLNSAFLFLQPSYLQLGAHAQRLGRILHFRSLINFRAFDLQSSISDGQAAVQYFKMAYGERSFDEITLDFWIALSSVESHNLISARALISNFHSGMTKLRIDQDRSWQAYESFLGASTQDFSKSDEVESSLLALISIERESQEYDPLIDGGIVHVLRMKDPKLTGVTPSMIRNYRLAHGARIGVLETDSLPVDQCLKKSRNKRI
jgi:tetratricopeptide (TPR) repeat protein